jgi:hypothetical protein
MYLLFLWRLYLMVLRAATSLLGALEGVGPENQDFLGPEMARANAPRNDVARLKTITYCAIKTTGTLIVITCSPSPDLVSAAEAGFPPFWCILYPLGSAYSQGLR